MNAALCVDDLGQFEDFKTKRGVLEWLLHLTFAKEAQVTAVGMR